MHWWMVVLPNVAGCGVACDAVVGRAARDRIDPGPLRSLRLWGIAAGSVAGLCVVAAACRAGSLWWLVPLAPWAVAVAACAVCDAATQRIPNLLIGYAAATIAPLLVVAAALTRSWSSLPVAAVAALVAAAILAVCWRFLGLGFGDVRLGALGGLGLGHTHPRALAAALLVFALVSAAQAIVTYVRTRDRRAHFPLGPALVAGFLTAAVA